VASPLAGSNGWDALYLAVAAALSSTVHHRQGASRSARSSTRWRPRDAGGGLVLRISSPSCSWPTAESSTSLVQCRCCCLSLVRVAALVVDALRSAATCLGPPLFRRVGPAPGTRCWSGRWPGASWSANWPNGCTSRGRWPRLVAGSRWSTFPYALDLRQGHEAPSRLLPSRSFSSAPPPRAEEFRLPTWGVVALAFSFAVFTVANRLPPLQSPRFFFFFFFCIGKKQKENELRFAPQPAPAILSRRFRISPLVGCLELG